MCELNNNVFYGRLKSFYDNLNTAEEGMMMITRMEARVGGIMTGVAARRTMVVVVVVTVIMGGVTVIMVAVEEVTGGVAVREIVGIVVIIEEVTGGLDRPPMVTIGRAGRETTTKMEHSVVGH